MACQKKTKTCCADWEREIFRVLGNSLLPQQVGELQNIGESVPVGLKVPFTGVSDFKDVHLKGSPLKGKTRPLRSIRTLQVQSALTLHLEAALTENGDSRRGTVAVRWKL